VDAHAVNPEPTFALKLAETVALNGGNVVPGASGDEVAPERGV
jgi:hypothetical protein